MDPEGLRTLGVVTKLDIMDKVLRGRRGGGGKQRGEGGGSRWERGEEKGGGSVRGSDHIE